MGSGASALHARGGSTPRGTGDLRWPSRIQADTLRYGRRTPGLTAVRRRRSKRRETGVWAAGSGSRRVAAPRPRHRQACSPGRDIFSRMFSSKPRASRRSTLTPGSKAPPSPACTAEPVVDVGEDTVDIDKRIKATMVGLRIGACRPAHHSMLQFPINPGSAFDRHPHAALRQQLGRERQRQEIGLGFFWSHGAQHGSNLLRLVHAVRHGAQPWVPFHPEFGLLARQISARTSPDRPGSTRVGLRPRLGPLQAFPHPSRTALTTNLYSSISSRQNLQDSLDYSSTRTGRAAFRARSAADRPT